MPSRHKKRSDVPTHDEVSRYAETATLFKSNLFRLQTTELLREISPFSVPLTRLETAVRALRSDLMGISAADLSWERDASGGAATSHPHLKHLSLVGDSVRLPWRAPASVQLVGSYLLRTTAAPALNVDLAVEIPAASLHEKDYLDQRYVDKRLLYLTHLAHALSTQRSQSVISHVLPMRFVALSHLQSHRWPVLEVHLRDPNASGTAASGGVDSTAEISGWAIRLVPCLAPGSFPTAKLRPQRCNLRWLGSRPSAVYNNALCLEASYVHILKLLHATFALDSSGALREAVVLLKVWLRQRGARQAGGLSGFQMSLLLVYLLHMRAITFHMGSYHILRVVLSYLSKGSLGATPLVLPATPIRVPDRSKKRARAGEWEADDSEGTHTQERVEGGVTAHTLTAEAEAGAVEAARAYASYFPLVITDSTGQANFGCGVSRGALAELRAQAHLSLATLDCHEIGDDASFASLFTGRRPLCTAYDALLTITLPASPGGGTQAAGCIHALPLPAASWDDPTEGTGACANGVVKADGGVLGGGAAAVETLLLRGLASRLELARAWKVPLAPWAPLHASPPPARIVLAGLNLDRTQALSLVDRGPPPSSSSEAAAWQALWGDRSETRRFKDGAIVHAVVWDLPPASRHVVIAQAARHLLSRHLGVPWAGVCCSIGGLDDALSGPASTGLSHTSAAAITKAYDALVSSIRSLKQLPLAIRAVHATSAVFADLTPFPPTRVPTGAPPPAGAVELSFTIQFESSGKWPGAPADVSCRSPVVARAPSPPLPPVPTAWQRTKTPWPPLRRPSACA